MPASISVEWKSTFFCCPSASLHRIDTKVQLLFALLSAFLTPISLRSFPFTLHRLETSVETFEATGRYQTVRVECGVQLGGNVEAERHD
jgi:hypothetical protein